jgi:hypothetical protein
VDDSKADPIPAPNIRHQKRWTPVETQTCRELVRRMSAREAAEILGRSMRAVHQHMSLHCMDSKQWRPPSSHPWRKAVLSKHRRPA